LNAQHPLVVRAAAALGTELIGPLFARRCLYKRKKGLLLVTEVFLPNINAIRQSAQPRGKANQVHGHEDAPQ
jgi:chorismate--pyruvate lyase